ncbi:MAG: hypothetical protein LQ350_005632 [Teloschistes chrysophthalmus]|nr:MAG: hypothetical protein LQ350_005632 [Niorma chrysophthalma]
MAPPTTDTPHDEEDYWIFGYGEDHRGTLSHPGRVVTLISSLFYTTLLSETPRQKEEHEDEREGGEGPPYRVHGAAYHIPRPHVRQVQDYLDIREINGYSMQYTTFHPSPSPPNPPSPSPPPTSSTTNAQPSTPALPPIKNILVYIGLPSNPQFLGPQSQDELAERIVGCKGPSGENREYLFMLRDALRDLHRGEVASVGDRHVEDLAERVERLVEMEREGVGKVDGNGKVVGDENVEKEI